MFRQMEVVSNRLILISSSFSSRIDPLYRYENQKDAVYPEVKPWPLVLERLRDKIFEITGQRCNHCVVNQYRGNQPFQSMI